MNSPVNFVLLGEEKTSNSWHVYTIDIEAHFKTLW